MIIRHFPEAVTGVEAGAIPLQERLHRRLTECLVSEGEEAWFQLRPDLFCIPHDGAYLLYSPLQHLIFAIDHRAFAALLTLGDRPAATLDHGADPAGTATGLALLDSVPKQYPKTVEPGEPFRPARVMLSLTNRCQFACRYCYIRGGEGARDLPWPLAEAALRFALDARRGDARPLEVEFHGEGEPTLNWSVLKESVLFIEAEAAVRGLETTLQLGTNGMLSPHQVAFLADHRIQVTLSMDGLRTAMETQRPLRGGGSSFDAVVRTIHLFDEHQVAYGIRCTAGADNNDEIPEWIRFLGTQTGCRRVAIEPVADAGRAAGSLSAAAVLPGFPALLQLAREEGLAHGITVRSAELQLAGVRRSFCSGYGGELSFCVSTTGVISSCYAALGRGNPRGETFCYGHFNQQAGAFHLDQERIASLQGMVPAEEGRCRTCFARWSCAGGCRSMRAPARTATGSGALAPEFCRTVRTMTKDDLLGLCVVMSMTHGNCEGG